MYVILHKINNLLKLFSDVLLQVKQRNNHSKSSIYLGIVGYYLRKHLTLLWQYKFYFSITVLCDFNGGIQYTHIIYDLV